MPSRLAATASTSVPNNPQRRLEQAHQISQGSSGEQGATFNYGNDWWSNNPGTSPSTLVHRPAMNPQGRSERIHPFNEGSSVEQAATFNYGDNRWFNNPGDPTSIVVPRPANNRAASFLGERQQENQGKEDDQGEEDDQGSEYCPSESVSEEEADSVDGTPKQYTFVSEADLVSSRSRRQNPSLKCKPCFKSRRFCDNAQPRCGTCVEKSSICVPQGSTNYEGRLRSLPLELPGAEGCLPMPR